MLRSPGAVAFNIGPVVVHWYGIIIAFAFLAGLFVISKIAKSQNEDVARIQDLAIYILVGAIIGSRLYFVAFNWDYYSQHLSQIFMTWQGGLSIHGGMIGGFLTGVTYAKIHKMSVLKYADLFAYGIPLGQSIGRWGNFFNSEAFGSPTNLPWKLYIPIENRPEQYIGFQYFHPAFLYESFWDLFIFLLLVFVLRKKIGNINAAIFFSYLILYSVGRLVIESIRIDSIFSILGIPLAQFISILIILIGTGGLYYVTVFKKPSRQ